ncbi:oligosaccharide flippase family protein [Agrobacterium sp. Azo12]|uniref:oligosaccharide flippase family protein n=1 Tax=Agrobacterium sp. Azo12 TaxID=3031129 RepID=UPI0023D82574|nr:oligosaccharide flippase family protein [Agrobacterium sp. Azo12]MDO5896982.1 oligosaccharide flippase family protein [Agrobacterium sp. Azo12]
MSFRTNFVAMFTGTALAQALPILASPLLTRLYGPEAYGLQTLFMGIAASLAVVATCRLDLAIVLPDDEAEAKQIASLVCMIAGAVSTLTFCFGLVAFLFFGLFQSNGIVWVLVLPLMVVAITAMQVGVAFATRTRSFRTIAGSGVINQTGFLLISSGIGIVTTSTAGLVFGKFVGQVLAATSVLRNCLLPIHTTGEWNVPTFRQLIARYYQFFVFNTPYSLVGTIARDAPIFLFTAFSNIAAAGAYALARSMLLAPTLLVSNSLSQVFFKEAVAKKSDIRLEKLTLSILSAGIFASAPLFAFAGVFGEPLFIRVFGVSWGTAGMMAAALAPAAWLALQTGWPERLFEVHMRQGVSFVVQISCDVITAIAVASVLWASKNPLWAVIAYTICNIAYHHIYLYALFKISAFSVLSLAKCLLKAWLLYLALWAGLGLQRQLLGESLISLMLAGLVAGFAASLIGLYSYRKANQTRESLGDSL